MLARLGWAVGLDWRQRIALEARLTSRSNALFTTDDVVQLLEQVAPSRLAESWDNVGWQVRQPAAPIEGALIALEATPLVLEEATARRCNLLFVHHPTLFRPISSLDLATPTGFLLAEALRRGISIWSAHTNLDVLPEGTSMAMARVLDLDNPAILAPVERTIGDVEDGMRLGYGAVAQLETPATTEEMARKATRLLGSAVCQVAGRLDRVHNRVAVMGGSGAPYVGEVVRDGASLFLTADVRYHDAQDAVARGVDVVILDHYATERPVLEWVQRNLEHRLPGLPVLVASTSSTPYSSFYT